MHKCTPLMAIAALFAILQAPLTSEAAGENKLEVFSWWTSGSEAAALNGLLGSRPELTYKALAELGKAMKTIFLCRYLHSGVSPRLSTRSQPPRAARFCPSRR